MVAVVAGACGKNATPIAELTEATGPVDRQPVGNDDWKQVRLGTGYFLGDAARTRDGKATLDVGRGAAKIVMQGNTVLRFGGRGQNRLAVEGGSIDLSGSGNYALDVGDVSLTSNGAVRITAQAGGRSTFELTLGGGRVEANGRVYDLELGKAIEVDKAAAAPTDAGVARVAIDAAVDATPDTSDASDALDAGDTAPVAEATITVTGKRAELLAPGQLAWKPLPAGVGTLAPGSAVRLGPGTTARVVARGTTLELAGGARMKLSEELAFALDLGGASASATEPAQVALPGGAIALAGAPTGAAEVRLDSNQRETKVTMQRGGSKLTGNAGAQLSMSRGETASLTRAGTIRTIDVIPSYFDFRVVAGESLTIHDPRPPTALQFQFDGKCPDGGIVEIDRNGSFRTAKVTSGRDFANAMIPGGTWSYRLRCTAGGGEGGSVASGRIASQRDDGRRPLPKLQGVNEIDADGRNYTISYQSAIPSVIVRVRNPGSAHRLHLASGGREQTFESSSAAITIPGSQLHEGSYSYWIDRDGVKQDKVSNLTIDFDQTAPQVYVESPINGEPWKGDIDVRGAVLPGWTAAVGAIAIPIDKQRRFAAKVGIPGGNALAIRLSHPQRGVHYYLRRPSK